MKIGDLVKIVSCSDSSVPALNLGKIGIVTKLGDGSSVEEMITVRFVSGWQDSFWPEELEFIV